jgi:hypothetical protein
VRAEILNKKQVAQMLGKHPNYFRAWMNSPKGERFRRVVKEREPNEFNLREVERYLEGANY